MQVDEIIAKVSCLTPSDVKNRLVARSYELLIREVESCKDEVVPPKELLMYLVRMGSFTSAPKILNNDDQDDDLHIPSGITRKELLQFCRSQPNCQKLIARNFRRRGSIKDANNAIGFNQNASRPDVLRVFQWNVLSQALGQMNDNFVRCPDEALEWSSRRFHVVEEIVQYCPDIICLQEVDHYNFLRRILDTQGYSGFFFPKPDSPCFYIDGNNGPDGCAIFYRRSKFETVFCKTKVLDIWKVQSNQVAIFLTLRIRETGQEFCVVTTHLKARNGTVLSMLRNEQGKDLLQFISNNYNERPVIVCGDFNAEPTEPVYNTFMNNDLIKFSSAYADSNLYIQDVVYREPPYTTWKIREEGEVCHTIDYIFYGGEDMEVEAVLDFPSNEEIGEDRVPSFSYPSDHFSLVCDLKLKNRKMSGLL